MPDRPEGEEWWRRARERELVRERRERGRPEPVAPPWTPAAPVDWQDPNAPAQPARATPWVPPAPARGPRPRSTPYVPQPAPPAPPPLAPMAAPMAAPSWVAPGAPPVEPLVRYPPLAPEAQRWLSQNVRVEVAQPYTTRGGGGLWHPDESVVQLETGQQEAAIHELSHAIWEDRRRDRKVRDGLVAAVQRLAADPDPRWSRARMLAGHYIHGIADQPGFEQGFLLPAEERGTGAGPEGEWNDNEIFAGLASGTRGDIRLLPPYLRGFFVGVLQDLPPEAEGVEQGLRLPIPTSTWAPQGPLPPTPMRPPIGAPGWRPPGPQPMRGPGVIGGREPPAAPRPTPALPTVTPPTRPRFSISSTAPIGTQTLAGPPQPVPLAQEALGQAIDPRRPLEEVAVEYGLMRTEAEGRLGRIGERQRAGAAEAREAGRYRQAVRKEYLADASEKGWVNYVGELLNVPARATEQLIGRHFRVPEKLQFAAGVGVKKKPLVGLPQQPPEVRDYLVREYGDNPRTQEAAAWAESIAWSGTGRMFELAQRVLAGEDPVSAAIGRKMDLREPTLQDYAAYLAYLHAVENRGGDVEAARQKLHETHYIPASSAWYREMAGQIFADPTNWIPVGEILGFAGKRANLRRAFTRWTKAAAVVSDDVAKNADTLAAVAKAAGSGDVQNVSWTRRVWKKINPFEPTRGMRAVQAMEPATQLATVAVDGVTDPALAKSVIQTLADHPARLKKLGAVAASEQAAESSKLLKRVAGQLDNKKLFPSLALQEGQAFNPAEFVENLADVIRFQADEMYGVGKESKNAAARLADATRSVMRDAWMTTNPSYPIRNAVGDLGNATWDGFNVLGSNKNAREYIKRLPSQTQRTLGLEAGPTVLQKGKGLTEVPIIGPIVQKGRQIVSTGEIITGKPTLLGEESRYAQVYVPVYQQANAMWWKSYQIDPKITDALGPRQTRALRGVLQDALSMKELKPNFAGWLGDPVAPINVSSYLDDVTDLSPAFQAQLNVELAGVDTADDVAGVFSNARRLVQEQADKTIAAGLTPPCRKAFTEAEGIQDIAESVSSAGALARQMGVPDKEAVAGAEAIDTAIRKAQVSNTDAQLRLMREAAEAELDPRLQHALFQDIRTAINDKKLGARLEVDELLKKTRQAWNNEPTRGDELWRRYRSFQVDRYDTLAGDSADLLESSRQAIQRLKEGEYLDDVLPNYRRSVDEATTRYGDILGNLAQREEAARALGVEDMVDFQRRLEANRLTVDSAEEWAWRTATSDPMIDSLDVIASADADVWELARASRYKHAEAVRALKAKEISYEQYLQVADAAWKPFWDQAPQRWYQAASEIVVGSDATPGAVSIEALKKVADGAGVDLSDLSKLTQGQWETMATEASRLSGLSAGEASKLSGARGAAMAGPEMDLLWPDSVEDVARWLGLDPADMKADDWNRVAQIAEDEGTRHLMEGTEMGRSSLGARAAKRTKTGRMVDIFGEEKPETIAALSRREEQEFVRETARKVRVKEKEFLDWVLGQVRYTDKELEGLNLRQTKRLTEELAEGKLLRTKAGKLSKIGDLTQETREAALALSSPELTEILGKFGTMDNPLSVQGYQWFEMAEQAKARAALGPSPMRPIQFYQNGRPLVGVTADQITEMGEQAVRQSAYADDFSRIGRMAGARAEALVDIPTDPVARAASSSWNAISGEDVVEANAIHQGRGLIESPRPATIGLAAETQQLDALDGLERKLLDDWDEIRAGRGDKLDPETRKLVKEWYEKQFVPAFNERSIVVGDAARMGADFALLDYRLQRRADLWLATAIPYPYWYTRSARNWGLRVAARPGILGTYMKYKRAMRRWNEERGAPTRMEGKIKIKAERLPEWAGREAYIDPLKYLFPFEAMMGYNMEDPREAKNGLDAVYRTASLLGMRPFPYIQIPLQMTGAISPGTDEIWNLLPQTAPLQSATAGLRQMGVSQLIPPGGFYIEQPVRRLLNLPEMEPAAAYRIERSAVSMAFDRIAEGDPAKMRLTLIGMELIHGVVAQEFRLGEAMGLPLQMAAAQEPGVYMTEKVRRLAKAERWTDQEVRDAQILLAEAVQRAAMERAATVLTGQTAFPAYLYPTGEEAARQTQAGLAQAGYAPLTGLGSRAERMEYMKAHPEVRLRPRTFEVLPGEEQEEYGPAETIRSLDQAAEQERLIDVFAKRVDEHIKTDPWDTSGVGEIRGQMGAALAAAREQFLGTEEPRLWSTYAATPEEADRIRQDQLVSAVRDAEPKLDSYTDPETGEMDYDAWRAAKAEFYEKLDQRMIGDPVVAMMGAEQGLNPKEAATSLLGSVTEGSVISYRRRNDSPLQAAQRIWAEELYGKAWEAYRIAVDEGMDNGEAYETFIKGLPEIPATALIAEVQRQYADRWEETELLDAYGDLTFPAGDDAHMLKKPVEEQMIARAQNSFWDYIQGNVPPGQFEWNMRDSNLLLGAISDFDTRQALEATGWSEAQWTLAQDAMRDFVERNRKRITGNPEEWANARALNSEFIAAREGYWPGIGDLLAERSKEWGDKRLSKTQRAARDAFDAEHPEIAAYRGFEQQYAAQNPVWATYYRPWLVGEEEAAAGAGAGAGAVTAAAGGGWGGYGGGYGGGGRRVPAFSGWQEFAELAGGGVTGALYDLWGKNTALPASAFKALRKLHKTKGWGDFETWLTYLRGLYVRQFPSLEQRATRAPSVRYPHWLPGVWS